MMKIFKYLTILVFVVVSFQSCKKDDNNITTVPLRDYATQAAEDHATIEEYLQTHFYYMSNANAPSGFTEFIEFGEITGANAGETPLMDQVYIKQIEVNDVMHNLYILRHEEGLGNAPKFSDSTLTVYKGNLFDESLFDVGASPTWFDNLFIVEGFREALVDFKDATSSVDNPDGTTSFVGNGIGAVFMPSALAYYQLSFGNIPVYSPIMFRFSLLEANTADHDRDHVPTYLEDLNNNNDVEDDDTDNDTFFNFLDSDDDGDGTSTIDEDLEPDADLTVDRDGDGDPTNDIGDGDPTNDDTDGDGIPNYLDTDDTQSRDD